jgi:DNA-binding MarR family transcriptional regulator
MTSVTGKRRAVIRRRQHVTREIRELLRELRIQLTLLNHQVGAQIDLRDVDLDCLDLIALHGPVSPSELARHAGLHPATMTGILDRLERGKWVARDRDSADRRAVLVRALNDRSADLMRLYSPMSKSMNEICAGYEDPELDLLADFLRRATSAGQDATRKLSIGEQKN